jgi:hypothetical protein
MIESISQCSTSSTSTANNAVESGALDHLDDRLDSFAFLSEHLCIGSIILHLTGGIRSISKLVFESHHFEASVATSTIGDPARDNEACGSVGPWGHG